MDKGFVTIIAPSLGTDAVVLRNPWSGAAVAHVIAEFDQIVPWMGDVRVVLEFGCERTVLAKTEIDLFLRRSSEAVDRQWRNAGDVVEGVTAWRFLSRLSAQGRTLGVEDMFVH